MSDEVTRQMREQREETTEEAAWVKENAELRKLLAELREDNKQLRIRAERAESALEDLESASRDLIRSVNEKKQQAEHSSAVGDCLRKELEDAQNGCLKLGAEVIGLREERDKWKVEAATRFNQITGLNTKVNELKEEISHLRGLRRQNDAVIKELRMLVVAGLKG